MSVFYDTMTDKELAFANKWRVSLLGEQRRNPAMTNNTSTHDTFAAVPGNRCLRGLPAFWGRFYSFDSRLLAGGCCACSFFFCILLRQNRIKRPAARTVKVRRYLTRGFPSSTKQKVMGFPCGGEKKIAAVFLAVLPLPVLPRLDPNGVPSIGLWKPAVNGVGDGV